MPGRDALRAEIVLRPVAPDDRAAAVRAVCAHAHNAGDAERLLAMLGLDAQEAT